MDERDLYRGYRSRHAERGDIASQAQRRLALVMLSEAAGDDAVRRTVSAFVTGHASSRDWTDADVLAWLDLLEPVPDPVNGRKYHPSRAGRARVERLYRQALSEQGQLLLFGEG